MPPELRNSAELNPEFLIEFPFRLRSELLGFSVATDLIVSHMDDGTKTRLLKIEKAQYDDEGKLTGFTPLPGNLLSGAIGPDFIVINEFCSSNYVLVAPSLERAQEFNFALKLAENSSSALYIGFNTTTAALAKQRRNESRFIEIAIILEMLLLPHNSPELSYRFSLRLAKLLNKLTGKAVKDAFKLAHRIYTTRSHLVHTGSDKDLEEIGPVAYNYVRILLAAYLRDRTLFQETHLDELCLNS